VMNCWQMLTEADFSCATPWLVFQAITARQQHRVWRDEANGSMDRRLARGKIPMLLR
jgi:hypothetical protein